MASKVQASFIKTKGEQNMAMAANNDDYGNGGDSITICIHEN